LYHFDTTHLLLFILTLVVVFFLILVTLVTTAVVVVIGNGVPTPLRLRRHIADNLEKRVKQGGVVYTVQWGVVWYHTQKKEARESLRLLVGGGLLFFVVGFVCVCMSGCCDCRRLWSVRVRVSMF
jgi:hypothetical protein